MTSPPTPPHRGPSFDTSSNNDTGEVPLIPFDDDDVVPSSSAGPDSPPAVDEPAADVVDDDDEDFAPRPRQRYGLLSGLLVLALAIALGFLGGEIVQKHYGTAASASGVAARRAAFPGGEGGFGGFGAGNGTGNGAGTGARAGTGNAAGTGTATPAVPAVIGTVASIKGNTVVVKNLGGKSVTVRLNAATTITISVKNKALKVGQTVAVVGTTAAGIVTARSVTVQ